jgi:hypothetical protein
MAKAGVTAPAMHTILHDKKGVLKGQFQKILQRDEEGKGRGHRPCHAHHPAWQKRGLKGTVLKDFLKSLK